MQAYLFPGQGNQFSGMGKDLFEKSRLARNYFKKANNILGFSISEVMFEGNAEEIKQTIYAQPAIFLHSYILVKTLGNNFRPTMVAGHSLGEISALTAIGSLDFESALKLISIRASLMQKVFETEETGMAVVMGLYDIIVQDVCSKIDGIVAPANYNAPKQVVISGGKKALKEACDKLRPGATDILSLPVSGAFHSPYMEPIIDDYRAAVEQTTFKTPKWPIYQNVTARPTTNIATIKKNLVNQLTHPVLWRQTIRHMIADGAKEFTEIGPGNFLRGLVHQINKNVTVKGIS
ncbi:ACP S-malonyltransferase [Maribacter sp. MMG018]|uniref:ACP S-malonyltransferase n=1 Tax=Maribacter sp. MMG018 TaxID=2822688 RepID=UPI001B38132A|nr:ACP S-malonyltransferase [Maribacter sp. MMG018]MBQ4915045.1 ACP S-malonyltransferase [Maribacter sp. MMG018]